MSENPREEARSLIVSLTPFNFESRSFTNFRRASTCLFPQGFLLESVRLPLADLQCLVVN